MTLLPETVFDLFVRQCWQIAAVAVVVGLVTRPIRRRHPHLAYALWLVVLVKAVVPPVWASPTGLLGRMEMRSDAWVGAISRSEVLSSPEAVVRSEPASPGPLELVPATLLAGNVPTKNTALRKWTLAGVLLGVWGIGAVVTATWIALVLAMMWRKLRRTTAAVPPCLIDQARELSVRLGLNRTPEIILTESFGPAVCGLFRPRILLPAKLAFEAPPERLEAILAHEMIHIRRGDLYMAMLQTLVQSVWWFHPLFWWASREMSRQRERCCDLEVLASGLCAPADYAQCLIDTIRLQRQIRPGVLPLGLTDYLVNRQRLEEIMQPSSVSGACHRRLSVAVVFLAALLLLPGRGVIQSATSQDAEPIVRITGTGIGEGMFQGDSALDTAGNGNANDEESVECSMRITVLGSDDKPLAGAKIHAGIWTKEPFQANRDYVCDAKGKATIELPKTIDILRLWASKDGHVTLFAQWWPEMEAWPREIPREFTFRLENGTVIGGIVKDKDGKPIVGVKVCAMLVNPDGDRGLDKPPISDHPIPDMWLAAHDRTVDTRKTTDSLGRWALDTAPAGDEFEFLVMLIHPDYISDDSWGGLQTEQNVSSELLRERTGAIVMRQGTR